MKEKEMEKRSAESIDDALNDELKARVYQAAYEDAKAKGVLEEGETLEDFKSIKIGDLLRRLKAKGISEISFPN